MRFTNQSILPPRKYFIRLFFLLIALSVLLPVGQVQSANKDDSFVKDSLEVIDKIEIIKDILFYHPDSGKLYIDSIFEISQRIDCEFGCVQANNLMGNYFWMTNNLDSALYYYQQGLEIESLENYPRKRTILLSNIGLVYSHKLLLDSAKKYLLETVDFGRINNYQDMVGKALFDLGNLYLVTDDYVNALKYLTEAKNGIDSDKDSLRMLFIYNGFGTLYTKVNDFELSLESYMKCIEYDNNLPQIDNRSNIYISIGELYFRVADNMDSALIYYRKALDVALPHNRPYYEIAAYLNIGNVFLKREQYDSVKYYYDKVFTNPQLGSESYSRAAILVNLGMYYNRIGVYDSSEVFLLKGLKITESLGLKDFRRNALYNLAQLKENTGKTEEALNYYKEYMLVSDSIQVDEARNRVEALKFEKFVAEKKYDIQLLEHENKYNDKVISVQQIIIAFSLVLLLVLLGFFIILHRRRKKINFLYHEISSKNNDLYMANEELNASNEELNAQQELLHNINISKDKLFSIIGHDLKSPFNSLLGFLSLLNRDWDAISESDKKEIVAKLFESSEKTYTLLENLLNWGKTQQGLIKPIIEEVNLKTKIIEISELFDSQLKEKNISLKINIKINKPVKTDARLFSQILQNLINNAIKFTPDGGLITVFDKKDKENLMVCVSDTGIGFPEEKIPNVFELDFDFNRPGTRNEKSSGMGLILCNEYSKLINTKLSVASKEGEGSTFCLRFSGERE